MFSIQKLALEGYTRTIEIFLNTFSFVPDDKLTWSPSATSKSALRIAAHIGFTNYFLAGILKGEALPFASGPELFAELDKKEPTITTRQAAIDLIKESSQVVIDAINSVTDEQLQGNVKAFFGERPTVKFIFMPEWHVGTHSAQVDYLQTVWGDVTPH